MHSWFEGQTSASSGEAIDVDGKGWTASLEAGYPLALSANWTLEPQAQLLWQQVKLDDRADSFSTIDFATGDVLTGRAGRSEERRVGKECVSTCRSRWSPSHYKKKNKNTILDTNTA